jgi:hypothetical protein
MVIFYEEVCVMPDYHALYMKLFNAQTDAIGTLQATVENLIRAHREAEDVVMESSDTPVRPLPPHNKGED